MIAAGPAIALGVAPGDWALPVELTVLLALFAATAAGTAALLVMMAAGLWADSRLGWIATAAGSYGLLTIPASLAGLLGAVPPFTVTGTAFLALIAVLLLPAVLPVPQAGRVPMSWVLPVAAGLVGVTVVLGVVLPTTAGAVTGSALSVQAVAAALVGLGVAVVVTAPRAGARPMRLVGAGFATLGVAHIWAVAQVGVPLAGGLAFSITRLVGTTMILLGTVGLMRRAVRHLEDQRAEYEEELRLAGIRLARSDERDHELRNGIAGLAGATTLIGRREDPQSALIGSVVASELQRLDDLLRSPAEAARRAGPAAYAVAPVVKGLATLRRSSGVEVTADVPPNLRAVGSSSLLTQVITNLLVNAARHAPDSPVHIRGAQRDGQVVIEVSDSGPGLAPGTESAMFERGTGGGDGPGLGLYICRELLASQGGTIAIRPADPAEPGCTVAVTLPAAPAALPTGPAAAPRGRRCMAS